jgi:hypothetical protein
VTRSSLLEQDYRAGRKALGRAVLALLGIPAVLLGVLLAWWKPWKEVYDVPSNRSIFDVVAGKWDWRGAEEHCIKDPHWVGFSADHKVMILTYKESWTDSLGAEHRSAEYDIQVVTTHHIRGLIRGETRLTEKGTPVVWDLVLTSPNSYRWHRTDWADGEYTKVVDRCPTGRSRTGTRDPGGNPANDKPGD